MKVKVVSGIVLAMMLTFAFASSMVTSAEASTAFVVVNARTGDSNFVFCTSTAPLGFRFNATVWVNNAVDLFAWQINLLFNDTLLKVTRASDVGTLSQWYDTAYIFYGRPVGTPAPVIGVNNVLIADSLLGGIGVSRARAKLALIEFEIISSPVGGIVSCPLHMDPIDTFCLNTNLDSYSPVLADGLYKYVSTPWDISGSTLWVPDGKCDTRDYAAVGKYWGTVEGDGKYDGRADITGPTYLVSDGKIDIRDIALEARHFGETYT